MGLDVVRVCVLRSVGRGRGSGGGCVESEGGEEGVPVGPDRL